MKNVIAIIKNAWGESPPPKVKTGFIPNLCNWEKKNYLTNPGSYYRQKASVGYIAMKGWLFTILRLPNCTFANQVFSYFSFPFSILNNQILAIYKLYNHLWNDIKVSYPVKSAMKKTAFIALFSGMVLSAGAQNTNRITEEEPDIKVTKDTVWNMATEKKAASKVQFPQPGDKIDVLDPIVYSLCYITAYDRLARKSVKVKTYRKEYAPYIHAGYDFGVKHWKEIVLKDYSSLRKQLRGIAESTGMERICFRNGALMGAYSTNPYPELDYIANIFAESRGSLAAASPVEWLMAGFICLIMILVSATVCSLAGYAVTGRHPKFCKLIWKTLAIILLFPVMALGILVAAFGFAYVICMRFASPMFDDIGWGWMLLLLFFSVMCLLGFSGFVVYLLEMNSEKLKKYDEKDSRRSFRPVDMNNHEKGGTI